MTASAYPGFRHGKPEPGPGIPRGDRGCGRVSVPAFLGALAFLLGPAHAGPVNLDGAGFSRTSTEGNFSYTVEDADTGATGFRINYIYTGPFNSADVDSADVHLVALFNSLYANPQNQSAYTDVDDMVGDGVSSVIQDDPGSGDPNAVNTGWNDTLSSSGLSLWNVGGIPGFDYETWSPGRSLYGQVDIAKSLLDGDGDGWNQTDVEAGVDFFLTEGEVGAVAGANFSTITAWETAPFLVVSRLVVPGASWCRVSGGEVSVVWTNLVAGETWHRESGDGETWTTNGLLSATGAVQEAVFDASSPSGFLRLRQSL